jgi:hypothetical protein
MKKTKNPQVFVHDKRGELSPLVSSRLVASLHGAASASVYCVLCTSFLPSFLSPLPTHQEAITTLQKQLGLICTYGAITRYGPSFQMVQFDNSF